MNEGVVRCRQPGGVHLEDISLAIVSSISRKVSTSVGDRLAATSRFTRSHCTVASESSCRPASVSRIRRTRPSAASGRISSSPRRSNGRRFLVVVVWSIPSSLAISFTLSGVSPVRLIRRVNCQLLMPADLNASSKRRPTALPARCIRRHRQVRAMISGETGIETRGETMEALVSAYAPKCQGEIYCGRIPGTAAAWPGPSRRGDWHTRRRAHPGKSEAPSQHGFAGGAIDEHPADTKKRS
jgi:hypothetical protein